LGNDRREAKVMDVTNHEANELIFGKFIREDETHLYYEGRGEYGVSIPKNAYWVLTTPDQDPRLAEK
jgi:hypothetical protein